MIVTEIYYNNNLKKIQTKIIITTIKRLIMMIATITTKKANIKTSLKIKRIL